MEHADRTHWWSRPWVLVVALVAVLAVAGGVFALVRSGAFDQLAEPSPSGDATASPSPSPTRTPTPEPTTPAIDYTRAPTSAWELAPADLGAQAVGVARADPFGTPYAAAAVVALAWSDGGARLAGLDTRTGEVLWQDDERADWRGCTALEDGTRTACAQPLADERWDVVVVETATGERVRTVSVDHWPIAYAGLAGDVVVAGYRCDAQLACWVVLSRHAVAGTAPLWAAESESRTVAFPSYLFAESLVADGGLLGFGMNGGLLVVDAATGAIRADLAYDVAGRLWPGGSTVTVDGEGPPLTTTVATVGAGPLLTADGAAWSLWDADGAAAEVVGAGASAYRTADGTPLWRLEGDLPGPGMPGAGAQEQVDVIGDVAVHLVTQDGATLATGYALATGEQLWTGSLDLPGRWTALGPYALATNGCRGTATGLDVSTGEVFWSLEPVPGETVEECQDRYRESFLLAGDVLLDSQDRVRAYAFPAS